jgi:hypothetical protein
MHLSGSGLSAESFFPALTRDPGLLGGNYGTRVLTLVILVTDAQFVRQFNYPVNLIWHPTS